MLFYIDGLQLQIEFYHLGGIYETKVNFEHYRIGAGIPAIIRFDVIPGHQ